MTNGKALTEWNSKVSVYESVSLETGGSSMLVGNFLFVLVVHHFHWFLEDCKRRKTHLKSRFRF